MFSDEELCNLIRYFCKLPSKTSDHVMELFNDRAHWVTLYQHDGMMCVHESTPKSRADFVSIHNFFEHLEVYDESTETA